MTDVVTFARAASLVLCIVLTTAFVALRWLRWHFLMRRFTRELLARDGVVAFLATVPAMLTPLCVGELVRVPLLRARFPVAAGRLGHVWAGERVLDLGVLLCALLAVVAPWTAAVVAVAFAAALRALLRRALPGASAHEASWVTVIALAVTGAAWSLPIVGLGLVVALLAAPVGGATSVRAFVEGTLAGGLGGFPFGVLGAGPTTVEVLRHAGVPAELAMLAVRVYRAGTAGFVVLLGLVSIVAFRGRLLRLLRGDTDVHFDEIAAAYEEEIPAHVRDRLLAKKVDVIAATLAAHGIPRGARGLDLGCGQGWYLAELCARGYAVDGTDYSTGQLANARAHVDARAHRTALLLRADARALPFADGSYDFVYGINALHHLVSEDSQERALREIVRVLRPGGVFLLHEINTINPVFRGYMGYLFPLLKKIDEGNERWVRPDALPAVSGARWTSDVRYFTFLPDFVPAPILRAFAPVETVLERSRVRRFSAHYQACLAKDDAVRSAPSA